MWQVHRVIGDGVQNVKVFFAGHGKGECPAGGGHDGTGSGDYILTQK